MANNILTIRDCVRTLIEYQTEDYPDYEIKKQQDKLNELYDKFSKKNGIINSRANNSVFRSDSSYCLLTSLEVIDDDGNFIRNTKTQLENVKVEVKKTFFP